MIRLFVLIVVLLAVLAVMLVVRRVFVRPALRRRHIAELEEENARLDVLLGLDPRQKERDS